MSTDRLELVKGSFEKKALPADVPQKKVSDYFGELVFDRVKMRKYLDAKTLASLLDCIDKGDPWTGRRLTWSRRGSKNGRWSTTSHM